jgi:hypothetical protein
VSPKSANKSTAPIIVKGDLQKALPIKILISFVIFANCLQQRWWLYLYSPPWVTQHKLGKVSCQYLLPDNSMRPEAIFLVVCDPSMNEL